jgi:hypothetical protein
LPVEVGPDDVTPREYFFRLMNDRAADPVRRDRAAQALLPFFHPRIDLRLSKSDDTQQRAAEAARKGKFGAMTSAPKLIVNN